MTPEQLEELKQFVNRNLEFSRNDMSGTPDYHCGFEHALESVLNWLEEKDLYRKKISTDFSK